MCICTFPTLMILGLIFQTICIYITVLNCGQHIIQYLNTTILNIGVSLKCYNNGQEIHVDI